MTSKPAVVEALEAVLKLGGQTSLWRISVASATSDPDSFESILAFIEYNWGLTPLTQKDAQASPLLNNFDFKQSLGLPIAVRIRRKKIEVQASCG